MALGKGLGSLIPYQKGRRAAKQSTTPAGALGDRVWHIPLTEIVPNREQPRKQFSHSDLEDLVVSIKAHGILQPITVTEKEDGGYELIAGERRFRASQIAGLISIPALVREATQQEKLELALIENIQRQNLNPVEEAFAYKRLIEEFHLTQQDVALQVGKSRPTVANTLRLLDLPDKIQKALIDGELSMGKARALLSLKSETDQLNLFKEMIGGEASVRDIERRVMKKGTGSRKGSTRRDPNIFSHEQRLEQKFGTRVTITQKGEQGTIGFSYHSRDELKRLLGELL